MRPDGACQQPPGLHYAAFRLDDGVSFLHVAVIDGPTNPLSASAAFGKFQAGIRPGGQHHLPADLEYG